MYELLVIMLSAVVEFASLPHPIVMVHSVPVRVVNAAIMHVN